MAINQEDYAVSEKAHHRDVEGRRGRREKQKHLSLVNGQWSFEDADSSVKSYQNQQAKIGGAD